MSRFFKSAAFPILIVVVLAFLAVKLVNPGSPNHRTHSYQTLVSSELPQRRSRSRWSSRTRAKRSKSS